MVEFRVEFLMSDKISIVNYVLFDYFIFLGFNLLGWLYKVFSEGVYSYDDGECLERVKVI